MGLLLLGLGLVALGAILLGDRADLWEAGEVISDWWPLAVVAVGAAQLANRPRPWLGAGIVIAIGLLLLLSQLDMLPVRAWDLFWPTLLIVIGSWLITSRLRGGRAAVSGDDRVNLIAVLGEAISASNSQAFTGGSLTAILGGAKLDLRRARPAAGGAQIDATSIFGGTEVIVPRGWDVRVSALPVFGGVEDKTRGDGAATSDAPRLTVTGVAIFGGVEVKHDV